MAGIKILTKSAAETKKTGERLAREILKSFDYAQDKLKTATVLSLEGELGAGKTTFTQGFAKGLGVKENPRSPTFVIMRTYHPLPLLTKEGSRRDGRFSNFIHIDAYRIVSKDLKSLGWKKLVSNPKNIILIEWGNRVKNILPKGSLRVKFEHGKRPSERFVTINQ